MSNPNPLNLEHGGVTVLSYGGGQDSWAILVRLAKDPEFRRQYAPGVLVVVMSDTGDENPKTREHVDYTQRFCRQHGIEFHHLTPDQGYHSEAWTDLRSFYNRTGTCGSKAFKKSCSDKLKIQPIYRWLATWVDARAPWLRDSYNGRWKGKAPLVAFAQRYGKIRVLIGIAAGEEKRVAKAKERAPWMERSIEPCYPLIHLGWDRKACQDYVRSQDEPVPVPSNCLLCPFANKIELLWLATHYPADYADWVRIEANKLQNPKYAHLPASQNLAVFGQRTLPEILEEARQEHGHLTPEELDTYRFSHGHEVCSRY